MSENFMIAVLAGLVVLAVAFLTRQAWQRDRTPLAISGSSTGIEVAGAISELPPIFLLPREPSEPPPNTPNIQEYLRWARQLEGIPVGKVFLSVVIHGVDSSPVIIDDIRVRVIDRKLPPRGYLYGPHEGGDHFARFVWADLDTVDSENYAVTVRSINDIDRDGNLQKRKWDRLRVSATDVEEIAVVCSTEQYMCEFEIEICYRSRYKSGTFKLRDKQGAPFKVTSAGQSTRVTSIPNPF